MEAYRVIYGVRVVEWDELDDVLIQLELGAQTRGGIDGCLSEPIALEALDYLAKLATEGVV